MSYQFMDGTPVRPDTGPSLTMKERIDFLEQQIMDLEGIVAAILNHPALAVPPVEL